jgi:hypothetical protein
MSVIVGTDSRRAKGRRYERVQPAQNASRGRGGTQPWLMASSRSCGPPLCSSSSAGAGTSSLLGGLGSSGCGSISGANGSGPQLAVRSKWRVARSLTTGAGWPRLSSAGRPPGQVLVELTLLLPILMLVLVGGLFLGLAVFDRMQISSIAYEGARAAAMAPSDPERCTEARLAIHSVSGRLYGLCDGSTGLLLEIIPGPRSAVRVTLTDQLAVPPLLDFAWSGAVSATAGSIIADVSPSPSPSP